MKIIANPRAGHGKGARNIEALRDAIRRRGMDDTVLLTERPRHATAIARDLAGNESRIAVLGGDGTIGEVADALAGSGTELAILSLGTGNDVARSLGLPLNDLEASLDVAVDGQVREIDLGRERDRHFISVLGLGFPAVVAQQANHTRLQGSTAFFVAVYRAISRLEPLSMTIRLDDRTLESECVAVMVQNTPFTGGGLRMAPGAKVDDGLFDVVVVNGIGKLDLMINFPRIYRGRHLEHPSFEVYRTRSVRIDAASPLPKMFDGDIEGFSPVEATVLPRALKVVVPPNGRG
ncbi:MAG: diacylglycerol/lipid kinase family protein [Gemmatimonadota bacterium]